MLIENIAAFSRTVDPGVEPVSLPLANTMLRVDSDDEAAYVAQLITAAREYAEEATRRALITQTWKATFDGTALPDRGMIDLPRPPLQSVTAITYLDADGAEQTLATSRYTVDILSQPGRIHITDMPTIKAELNALTVEYVAGYGSNADAVPSRITQAMLLMIGHWYENRMPVSFGGAAMEVPLSASHLLRGARVLYL